MAKLESDLQNTETAVDENNEYLSNLYNDRIQELEKRVVEA